MQALQLLIVEDNPDDADLLVRELRRAGFDPAWSRVETESDFLAALQNAPEIILSDYSMPHFSGLRALELLRASGREIPFILISGTVGEDVAVQAMRDGATDYLLKDRPARLVSAVKRALAETRLRVERNQAEAQLRLQGAALNAAANAIIITNRAGVIEWVNPAFSELTGYTAEEAVGKNPRDLVKSDQHDQAFYKNLWDTILSGQIWHGEMINRRKDGSLYTEEQTITPLRDRQGEISHFIDVKQDVTARKRAEEEIRKGAELSARTEREFRALFAANPLPMWIYDLTTLQFLAVNDAAVERYSSVTACRLRAR